MVRFKLLGIPVGVHLTFLLIAVIGPTDTVSSMVLWVVAAFTAIMLHEFGHALTARAFGAEGINVALYALGGVTSFTTREPLSHGRSFLISAAGSGVGIVAGLVLIGLGHLDVARSWPIEVREFREFFVFIALVWGILNWIPIVPLDGGHMAQHLFAMVNEPLAPLMAQVVTWITVAIIVPVALIKGVSMAAVIVVVFAFMGYQEYRRQRPAVRGAQQEGGPGPSHPQPAPPAPPTPPSRPHDPPEEPPMFPI